MEAIPAATVIAARPAERGPEVLVLRRSADSRFAPGFLVFPGGAIEPGDAALAGRLFGDPDEAARACALRELHEETGLLLSAAGLERHPADAPLDSLEHVARPRPADLPEVARWVAPEFLEVRFDARFFAVRSAAGVEPVPGRPEVDRAWWARAADLLDENARGGVQLMWPTLVMLEEVARCRSVEEVLGLRVEQVPPPVGRPPPPRRVGFPEGLRKDRSP